MAVSQTEPFLATLHDFCTSPTKIGVKIVCSTPTICLRKINMKNIQPSIQRSAFSCPHCATFTTQYWRSISASSLGKNGRPTLIDEQQLGLMSLKAQGETKNRDQKAALIERLKSCRPILHQSGNIVRAEYTAWHLYISQCYECDDIAIWIYDRMIWPERGMVEHPNPDLPPDVAADFSEAALIFDRSPRGSAALLRLAIQKLCVHLEAGGGNLSESIGNLVKQGLHQKVQMALDAVRVVGNNAVHPGTIDLNDKPEIAASLFSLVNLVADIMITQRKHVEDVYAALPEGAKKSIQTRDAVPPRKDQ